MIDIPGLIYKPDFLHLADQITTLFEIDKLPWLTDLKRRVQHYGYKYDYKLRSINTSMYVGELPPFAVEIAKKLHEQKLLPEMPDQMIVNEYQPGQGIFSHVDCKPCFTDSIATISLGSVYTMDLDSIDSEKHQEIRLELGSCLILAGPARYRWRHGIKARKTDDGVARGRRVSLTFRNVILL